MRLPQAAGAFLLSVGLLARYAAANPVPFPNALALAEAEPQQCPVQCGNICCTNQQYCSSWAQSQCGEGQGQNDNGASVFTTTWLITQTGVTVITSVSVWSSVPTGGSSVINNYPTLTGSSTPTLRPSGTNTFLVPVPSSTNGNDFNYGGIIGSDSQPSGLTGAQIGGIVGGILGAFFLIALILICCCMRRGRGANGFFGWMNSWGGGGSSHGGAAVAHGHGHGHNGAGAAAAGGLLGYLFGRRRGHHTSTHHAVHGDSHHHGSGAKKTGMAALLGGAAAGLTSIFASRRKGRMSEKYSTTDISSGYYTSDITETTDYTTTSDSSSSSSSSSESSESGHPHHGRR